VGLKKLAMPKKIQDFKDYVPMYISELKSVAL